MASNSHYYSTVPEEETGLSLSPQHTLELPHYPVDHVVDDPEDTTSQHAPPAKQQQLVTNVLRSLTGSLRSAQSYELVDAFDDDPVQITPRIHSTAAFADSTMTTSPQEETPSRTASISRDLPLHNPTPDLQALQGAYVKNVQALEDSAERISLSGSIEDALSKMDMEWDLRRTESLGRSNRSIKRGHTRNFSAASKTNSILEVNATARSGGYSPGGFVTSPVGSVKRKVSQRASRMSRVSTFPNILPEPELEGRPLESAMVHSPPAHAMQPRQSSESQRSSSQRSYTDRPGSSASNNTYRQAQSLFTDFDGAHFSPPLDDGFSSRRISLNHPPLARDSRVFKEPQPDHKTIYYPAPVPVMLNLPKRLSRGDWALQAKRHSQALQAIPLENRKSAAWLANAEIDAEYEEDLPPPKRMSHIPPQLRASVFFDTPSTRSDIKLKHGSAMLTLDSILDASAHAPVSAFTDHPIVGHLGNEVYGQEPKHKKKKSAEIREQRRQSTLGHLLGKHKSTPSLTASRRLSQTMDNELAMTDDEQETAADRSMAPDADELPDEDEDEKTSEKAAEDSEEEEEEEQPYQHQLGFLGAPTTLLAELQMRKAQQKLRNRTAATAFPGGMHSTLLELDAVTQLQQKSRKQKHVALAWEDQDAVDRTNFDDDNVPLGVLYPEKERQNHNNVNRPLGLMEKKELEENEPLSFRRARLRGEEYKPAPPFPEPSPVHESSAPALKLSGVDEDDKDNEDEEETLAQRRKRMQEKQNKRVSLADDIASQLGLEPEQIGGIRTPDTPGEQEETLGQRKKRLQAEAATKVGTLKTKTSMGDLLRANPVGPVASERAVSAEQLLMNKRDPSKALIEHIQAQQPASKALPSPNGFERSATSYFPTQQHQSFMPVQNSYPSMYAQAMPTMQSMPNLNMINGQNGMMGMAMPNFAPIQHYPYHSPNMNMSQMGLGLNNMMYNPMTMGMPGMQIPANQFVSPGPMFDPVGMGPPLSNQQRATIDRWRQGIA